MVDTHALPPPSAGYFGSPACYGVVHRPSSGCGRGVVIVNDFGYRGMCAYWTFRRLAERLCAAGLVVLRFDLPGTGDSAEVDGNRVDAWAASVGQAVAHLLGGTGLREVSVIGFGVGALLALDAALGDPKIRQVVLVEPFIDGNRYLAAVDATEIARRTQKKLQGGRLVGDHFLSSAEESSLRGLAMRAGVRQPPLEATVVEVSGDDSFAVERLLLEAGSPCNRVSAAGAAEWLVDPMYGKVPAFFDSIVARLAPGSGTAAGVAEVRLPSRHPTPERGYREEAVACASGEGGSFHGVLATPLETPFPDALVVFLTTAANRRCGMHDSSTLWARALARCGLTTLRFDASGFGDSSPHPGFSDNEVLVDRNYLDGERVIAEMRGRGFRDFGVLGLSSGGFSAFKIAQDDASVVALFGINTARFVEETLAHASSRDIRATSWYVAAMLRPETWSRLFRGDVHVGYLATNFLRRARERTKTTAKLALGRLRGDGTISLGQGHRDMVALLSRARSDVHLVYSEGDSWVENFEHELGPRGSALSKHPNFKVTFLAGADHGLSDPADAGRVAELACDFFRGAFQRAQDAVPHAPRAQHDRV